MSFSPEGKIRRKAWNRWNENMNPNPWKRWKECPQACREYWIAASLVIEGPRVPECCIGWKRNTCSGTSRGPHDSFNAASTPRTRTLRFCGKTEQWSNSSTLRMPLHQSPWRHEVCQCIPMCILWMPAIQSPPAHRQESQSSNPSNYRMRMSNPWSPWPRGVYQCKPRRIPKMPASQSPPAHHWVSWPPTPSNYLGC